MNYYYKYLKYKMKYLNLLDKINVYGGMPNLNNKNKVVEQIIEINDNGISQLKNVNINTFIKKIKNKPYTIDEQIIALESAIIESYNLINNIKENNKHDKINISIKKLLLEYDKLKKLHTYKKFNELSKLKEIAEIKELKNNNEITNAFFDHVQKCTIIDFEKLNKNKQKKLLDGVKQKLSDNNKIKFDKLQTELEKYNYLKDKFINCERGNNSEFLGINNPIPIQCFTGDFSEIKNSKNISAYLQESICFIKQETNLDNDELIDIFKFFPIDGISNKTLYELKSFDKNSENMLFSKYKLTKIYGYTNENYDLQLGNKKFTGLLSFIIKYKFPSIITNNKIGIENIIINMIGTIEYKNIITGQIIKRYVNIINLNLLKQRLEGYDYIWVEYNSNALYLKNALNKKYFDLDEQFNMLMLVFNKEKALTDVNNIINTNYKDINDITINNFYEFLIKQRKNEQIIEFMDFDWMFYTNIITKTVYDDLNNYIDLYISKPNSIPNNYKQYFKDTLLNPHFLLPQEQKKLIDFIILYDKLLRNKIKIKKEYIDTYNGEVISYIKDCTIYPTIQIDNMIKNIESTNEYNPINHLKRQHI